MMSNDMNNKSNRGCDKQEELVTYLYGEATPEASKQFETHMRECLICARELREFSSLRGTMQTWEMDTLPHIVIEPKRTFVMVLRELFTVTPIWAKAIAGVAALLIFAALLNVEVSVGNVKVGARLFGRSAAAEPQQATLKMEDVDKVIQQRVSESEQLNKQEMLMKLASLKEDLTRNHSEEIKEISANLKRDQQQQIRRIVNTTIANNDLNFRSLFNELGSSDKEDNKNK